MPQQDSSIVFDDISSKPRSWVTIEPGAEIAVFMVFGLVSSLLIDLPMVGLFRPPGGDFEIILGCVLSAAAMARFGCLAIWLAWGQSRVMWRLLIVLLNIIISVVIWTSGNDFREGLPLLLFLILAVSMVAAIPRLFGVHRINLHDPPADPTAQKVQGVQFRLTDMFAWTATVALLAGIFRWVGLPHELEWLALIFVPPVAGAMVLIAMWAALSKAEPIYPRVLMALLLTVGIGTVLTMLMGGQGDVALIIDGTLLIAMLLLIGCLYVVRRLGVRFVFQSSPISVAPIGIGSTALPIPEPQDKTSPEDLSPWA